MTLALLAFALLPWLQPLFKTVKLPGGIEITLQDIERKIEKATGAAESADRKAELAVSGITQAAPAARNQESVVLPKTQLLELAKQYDRIRETQEAGPARTSAMTGVARAMIQQATTVSAGELPDLLLAATGGERLIAYASLYGNPRPELLEALVASVTSVERKPFGQYWGLQAIGKSLPKKASDVSPSVLRALTAFEAKQTPGTDRHYALSEIFKQIRGQ